MAFNNYVSAFFIDLNPPPPSSALVAVSPLQPSLSSALVSVYGPPPRTNVILERPLTSTHLNAERQVFILFTKPKLCIPWRDSAKKTHIGSIWYDFHFIVSIDGCVALSSYLRKFTSLKSWKCLNPRMESTKQIPNSVHWKLFLF